MKQELEFKSTDGVHTIKCSVWEPAEKPVGVLQIIHGMSEYIDRYEPFAEYLNSFGIVVAGDDHLGHGRTAGTDTRGYFAAKDGWKILVEDEERFHHILKDKYPDCKVSVLGHSMGSLILRSWMAKHGKNSGNLIIMGTAGPNKAVGFGLFLAKLIKIFTGGKTVSKFMDKMIFGHYNDRIPNAVSSHDWLSANKENVENYDADPLCGFPFTISGIIDLLTMNRFVNVDTWYTMVPKNRPMLVIAGWDDPVGGYGKGPAAVADKLQKAGVGEVSLSLYEGMRHEILNENGKEAVFEQIKDFVLEA